MEWGEMKQQFKNLKCAIMDKKGYTQKNNLTKKLFLWKKTSQVKKAKFGSYHMSALSKFWLAIVKYFWECNFNGRSGKK